MLMAHFIPLRVAQQKKNRKEKMKEKKIGNNNINYTIRERDP
jgi:hypothetical protein